MVALAGEIGDGLLFSSGCLSHMPASLAMVPEVRRKDPAFFIGNRVRVCLDPDQAVAKAVLRKAMSHYALMPNYRNYWKEAGYQEEMEAIEKAIAEGRNADVPTYFSDKWLADNTLFGPAAKVREGVEAWKAAGVRDLIIVPSSAAGNQMKAIEEVFATFA